MSELWPRLEHIRMSYDLIAVHGEAVMLDDREHRALMYLVAASAAGLVWTYSEPGDGSLPDDDVLLARITRLSKSAWLKVRPSLTPFFKSVKGRWCLNRAWIAIDATPSRYAIPSAIQQMVLERQGAVCSYCGTTTGPFDYDHIFPVSRGGTNDPSNLTLACASCNRSKGARTLLEWMQAKTKFSESNDGQD